MERNFDSDPAMHHCCSHCEHIRGECNQEFDCKTCHYDTCSREELLKRIFIAQNFVESDEDRSVLNEMIAVFKYRTGGYMYDLHRYGLHHRICKECDGSGSIVGASGISSCTKCGGTGIIEYDFCNPHYTKLWFIFERHVGQDDVRSADLEYLYTTKEKAESVANVFNTDKHINVQCEVGELIISKNLIDLDDCTDIGDFASLSKMIITKEALGKVIVLSETKDAGYYVTGYGSWSELHNSTSVLSVNCKPIPPYQDIEQVSLGHIVLVRMDKMSQLMSIRTKESMGALYQNLLTNSIMIYCNTYATYGDAYKLATKYCGPKGKYKTWSQIWYNVMKYSATNNIGRVTDNVGKHLAEAVQEDFRQYGILLPLIDAFGVVEKLAAIMSKETVSTNLIGKGCDALTMFIVEYICISPDAEFNNITSAMEDSE